MKSSLAICNLILLALLCIPTQSSAQQILSLKELLSNNQVDEKLLQKTTLKTDENRGQKALALASLLPQLSANFKKEYAKSLIPSQNNTKPQEFSLNFSTPIFDGKSILQFEKSKTILEGRQLEEELEKQKLLKDLAIAFIDYYEAKNILETTEDSIKALEKYEKATSESITLLE